MNQSQRSRFDALVEEVIEDLPDGVRTLLDEVRVVVLDRATPEMLLELQREGVLEPDADASDLCGLHTGTSITERGAGQAGGWAADELAGALSPEEIHLFRDGIVSLAFASEAEGGLEGSVRGSWDDPDADDRVYEEIAITLRHEIGHHFGLDEDDLEELGYA